MFTYYNPNPKQKRVGDCVIRAICKATDQSWDDVYTQLCLQGLKMSDMPSSNPVWGSYLKQKGFLQVTIPNTCPDCYTVEDFCKEHPQGVYVLGTGTHAVCIADGCIWDAWDSSQEIPVYYFRR
jgi:NAD-dependent dihydropyrimidine dehydrogenase PreA subunit